MRYPGAKMRTGGQLRQTRGFGSIVIQRLAKESLDAEIDLDFAASGLSWRLRCPVKEVIEECRSPPATHDRFGVRGGIVLAYSEKPALGSRSRLGARGVARKPAGPLSTPTRYQVLCFPCSWNAANGSGRVVAVQIFGGRYQMPLDFDENVNSEIKSGGTEIAAP